MELHINPAQRLVEFIKETGRGNRDEAAKAVLMRVFGVPEGDIATMLRRFAGIVEIARGCVTVAEELQSQDPRVAAENVQAVKKVARAIEGVRFEAPWRQCYDKMGSEPVLAVAWLVPWYPHAIATPEQLRSWRDSLLEELAKANAVLESVPLPERDFGWLRVQRAVNRIVEFLNAIEVEGVEAAERAWVHALALESVTKDVGAGRGWWEAFVRRAKAVGQIASALNSIIQVATMLTGADTVAGAIRLPTPPSELDLISSGDPDDRG